MEYVQERIWYKMMKEELQRKIDEYQYMLDKTNMSYLNKAGLIREFLADLKYFKKRVLICEDCPNCDTKQHLDDIR